jgi:hypothetical protein
MSRAIRATAPQQLCTASLPFSGFKAPNYEEFGQAKIPLEFEGVAKGQL